MSNSSAESTIEEIISNDSTVLQEFMPKDENLMDKNTEAMCENAIKNDDYLIDQNAVVIENVLPSQTAYDACYDLLNTIASCESNNYDNCNFLFSNSNLGDSDEIFIIFNIR